MSMRVFNHVLNRIYPLFMIAAIASANAYADDLRGKVLDPDGRIVQAARVRLFDRISGTWRTTVSDNEGSYAFRNIPGGDYLLEADAANAALNAAVKVAINGNTSQDLTLSVSATSNEVRVTASNIPMTIQESAKANDIVDAQELELRSEFTFGEALRTLPGIRVQTLEGPGSATTIQTRGLRTSDTAVLVDGMRFRDAASIANDATSLLEEMILVDPDRIEFLRGSGSTLYGSNALAGVVNITSASGGGSPRHNLRFEGGGLGFLRGLTRSGGALFSDRLSYSAGTSLLRVADAVRDSKPYTNVGFQGSLRVTPTQSTSITGRAWYSHNYLYTTESPTAITTASSPGTDVEAIPLPADQLQLFENGQPFTAGNATYIPNTVDPDGRRRGRFLNASLSLQQQVRPGTSFRADYQALDTRRSHIDGPLGTNFFDQFAPPQSNFNGFVDAFHARLSHRIGDHSIITAGYEFEQQHYQSFDVSGPGSTLEANRVELRQRSNAVYVQDHIRLLSSRLQITAAGRIQGFSVKEPFFAGFSNPYDSFLTTIEVPTAYTADGAIAYFVSSSRTKFRAHVGNSFREPSGFERFGGGFGDYFGDPRLAPERAVAVDGGLDQWLFGSRLQVSATGFYTNLQQTIQFVNSFAPGSDPFQRTFGGYANAGGGIARGVEISAAVSTRSSWKLFSSYTYTNSDWRQPTIQPNYYDALGLSPHTFTLSATKWFGLRTNVTFDLSAYSGYTMTLSGGGTRRFKFDGPVKPDIVVRHTVLASERRNIDVYGRLENMFGRRAYEDGFRGPGAWFVAGVRLY